MKLVEYFWEGLQFMLFGAGLVVLGVVTYLVFSKLDDLVFGSNRPNSTWEFGSAGEDDDDLDFD